jgi:hypothetical protein
MKAKVKLTPEQQAKIDKARNAVKAAEEAYNLKLQKAANAHKKALIAQANIAWPALVAEMEEKPAFRRSVMEVLGRHVTVSWQRKKLELPPLDDGKATETTGKTERATRERETEAA